MSDDPTEALPPRGRSLRILVVEDHANTSRVLARLLDHFGMNIRSLFVCSALLLFASVAYGAGSYQRTRDGKTLVWNDSPKRGERFSVSRALIRAGTVSEARGQKEGAANKKRSDIHAEMIEQPGRSSRRVGVIFDDQNSQAPAPRRQSFCWIVAH